MQPSLAAPAMRRCSRRYSPMYSRCVRCVVRGGQTVGRAGAGMHARGGTLGEYSVVDTAPKNQAGIFTAVAVFLTTWWRVLSSDATRRYFDHGDGFHHGRLSDPSPDRPKPCKDHATAAAALALHSSSASTRPGSLTSRANHFPPQPRPKQPKPEPFTCALVNLRRTKSSTPRPAARSIGAHAVP